MARKGGANCFLLDGLQRHRLALRGCGVEAQVRCVDAGTA